MITKEKISGLIGATIFMALLLILLLFSYFTLVHPDELEGIPVMFGNMEDAYGIEESPMKEVSSPPVENITTPQTSISEEPLIAQTDEQTIAIKKQNQKIREEEERKQREQLEEQRRREEAERKRQEEEKRRQAINQQLTGLFGENNSGSRGTTEGTGTEGVSTGNTDNGKKEGEGGIGSYDLGGRKVGTGGLKKPPYTVDDVGTIVINILVDPKGNVINAEIGRGTNTGNATLRREALEAARQTKFATINSADNQHGTITYRFNLK